MAGRSSSGPATTSNPAPRRRRTKAVQSSPSLNMPSTIARPLAQTESSARWTIPSVGVGTPCSRRGQRSSAPSAVISRTMPMSDRACVMASSCLRARAPKRSMTSSSAPRCPAMTQLAPCEAATVSSGRGHDGIGGRRPFAVCSTFRTRAPSWMTKRPPSGRAGSSGAVPPAHAASTARETAASRRRSTPRSARPR